MPNSANTNANGRILFLFIAILTVGLCSAAGAYLLPKQVDVPAAPTVNLQQQATTVATPLLRWSHNTVLTVPNRLYPHY
ncbi:hypothetical protein NI376_11005 [Pseudoalteromonas piscicida]|nr:hypothetical protein NI376_11005 [Pseudoalteromonas piscicida]